MNILMISDIHGNLHALDAVLKQVPHDMLVCCGDLVVDYPFPEECVRRLSNGKAHLCCGNNDRFVAADIVPSQQLKAPYLAYGPALDRTVALTQQLITKSSKAFLRKLPRERYVTLDGVTFYLNHTAPELPIDRYFTMDTALTELNRLYQDIRADIMITGHTHAPYVKKVGTRLLINPGSVGEPRDGDPRASYATFDTRTGQVQLGRLDWDKTETERRLKELRFPNYARYCLRHGTLPKDPDDDGS